MANFMGGSAPSMAAQVADGFILVSANALKGFGPGDLMSLKAELDKLQREVRAETPAQDDAQGQQARNRRIARISSALQVIQNQISTKR
jgi:hypothetical protein